MWIIYFFCKGFTTSLSWKDYNKAAEMYEKVLSICGKDSEPTSFDVVDEFQNRITIANKGIIGLKLQYQEPEDISLTVLRNIQIEYTKELIKELKNKFRGDTWRDSYGKPDEDEGD